jgi:tetratricopeptide (TPR) repeat protein
MSLFGKLLGRRSAADERKNADELWARGEFGLAKLAYERALAAAGGEPDDVRTELARRVEESRDALARARLAEGEKLLRAGAHELAVTELQGAIEIAASAEIIAEAERLIEGADRRDAREKATVVELSDEERFEVIAGSFEEQQYEEYAAHGDELRAALLAVYDGSAAQARPVLERLIAATSEPRYLLFELGRARLLDGDVDGGREALQRFVALFAEGEGGEARLVAHMELAAVHDERGDFDAAAAEYEAAVEAMPDDPRPYLAMALFFRRSKLPAEAIEVLTSALDVLPEQHRQWRFTLELGLAYADLGDDARAIELLEDVVAQLTARQHLDLPPECALRLAELHEKSGNKTRALDLYNVLSAGSDVANRFTYHRQAARLMLETGHRADARRMLARAAELAPDDPAVKAELDRQLAELK